MFGKFKRITPLDHPDYRALHGSVSSAVWPEFMRQDAVANIHWDGLYEKFGAFQFSLLDEDGAVVGITNSVPLAWDRPPEELPPEGWDWALIQSAQDYEAGRTPRTLCGIQISIAPAYQGKGISRILLTGMRDLAITQGLSQLVVPVRPSLKSLYPLSAMESYIEWEQAPGLPFDPWLRVHVRNGGRIVKVCPLAMRIEGRIAEWEAWTGMQFPETNDYIVPFALEPITMDLEADLGVYLEPNVWVHHPLP